MRPPLRATLALASALALSACADPASAPPTPTSSSTQQTRTPMTDAVTLKENLPTQVDGVRLIAYNVEAASAGLHLGKDQRTVSLGDTVDVAGTSYTVAELVPSDRARGDHANGWISLTR